MNKTVDYKNGIISYSDTNQGRTIIFLHGFLESKEMWGYYHNLPKKYRKICIDLPGHGGSENFGYLHSMELMADAVYTVVKKEKLRKVLIIGHSMGGYVALAFAEKYPDMVKGINLFFSTPSADSEERKLNRNRAIKLVSQNKNSFVRNAIPLLFLERYRKKNQRAIRPLIKRAQNMGVQNIIAAIGGMRDRMDREIILKFAPYPIHFISGVEDPVVDINQIRKHSQVGDNTTIVELEDTGHMGFIESRITTFLEVKKFVERVYN